MIGWQCVCDLKVQPARTLPERPSKLSFLLKTKTNGIFCTHITHFCTLATTHCFGYLMILSKHLFDCVATLRSPPTT